MMKLCKYMLIIFLFSPVVLASDKPSLFLEGGLGSLIALRDSFIIEYSDQVSDGCLPQPSRMKDKMEISLRQNGFSIAVDDGLFAPKINITALGGKTGNICVVYIETDLSFWVNATVPFASKHEEGSNTLAPIEYEFGSTLLTGDKSSMQGRIDKKVKEFGDDLYLKISRAKDDLKRNFPGIIKEYESQKKDK